MKQPKPPSQKQIDRCTGMDWKYDDSYFYKDDLGRVIGYFVDSHFVKIHIDDFEGE